MQLEDEVPQPRDRQLYRLLGLRQEGELLRIAQRATQHLQAHPERGDDLDGVVVNARCDAPALLLTGRDEGGQ